jgi:molybdopterin/thiamine biosynthesis adenylyltransferase
MSEKGMLDPRRFDRNLGFMTERDRETLNESVVAIAGTGGDGGELAVKLARMGVRKFRLADPETFDLENLNRQEGSNYDTIGRNKAEVIAEIITKIHPDAEIELFTDGVTEENIEAFVAGSDVVIDETEYTMADIGVMIAREARKNSLPVFMGLNIGHGGQVTVYPPWGKTFEEHIGLDPHATLEEIRGQDVSIDKWVHRIPRDADMSVFKEVAAGNISAPSVVTGVGMAAGIMTAYVSDFLIAKGIPDEREKRKRLSRLMDIDANRGRSLFMTAHGERKYVKNKKASLAVSALRATVRGRFGRVPETHYTKPKH